MNPQTSTAAMGLFWHCPRHWPQPCWLWAPTPLHCTHWHHAGNTAGKFSLGEFIKQLIKLIQVLYKDPSDFRSHWFCHEHPPTPSYWGPFHQKILNKLHEDYQEKPFCSTQGNWVIGCVQEPKMRAQPAKTHSKWLLSPTEQEEFLLNLQVTFFRVCLVAEISFLETSFQN